MRTDISKGSGVQVPNMLLLTRRNILTFAAGAAANFLIRIPWVAGQAVSDDNFARVAGIDQRVADPGLDQFWYLGSGWEVPHDVVDRDRIVWKALKDQRTEPQSAGWRPVSSRPTTPLTDRLSLRAKWT